MHPWIKWTGSGLMLLLFLAGCLAIAYGWWTRPIAEADAALAQGQSEQALSIYAAAESRFNNLPASRQLFAAEYNRVVSNQLWLLYRLGRYDDTIEKALHAPEGANPHFWAGCAMFQEGDAEHKPEERQQWMNRAQDEFRQAVEASPNDFDAKYNFELLSRLQKRPTMKPQSLTNSNIHLLRPQPFNPLNKPTKQVG